MSVYMARILHPAKSHHKRKTARLLFFAVQVRRGLDLDYILKELGFFFRFWYGIITPTLLRWSPCLPRAAASWALGGLRAQTGDAGRIQHISLCHQFVVSSHLATQTKVGLGSWSAFMSVPNPKQ